VCKMKLKLVKIILHLRLTQTAVII